VLLKDLIGCRHICAPQLQDQDWGASTVRVTPIPRHVKSQKCCHNRPKALFFPQKLVHNRSTRIARKTSHHSPNPAETHAQLRRPRKTPPVSRSISNLLHCSTLQFTHDVFTTANPNAATDYLASPPTFEPRHVPHQHTLTPLLPEPTVLWLLAHDPPLVARV
jgi:hypothetical protein